MIIRTEKILLLMMYCLSCIMLTGVQWAGAASVAGDVVLMCGSGGEMVSAMVIHAQSRLGTDQMWTEVSAYVYC